MARFRHQPRRIGLKIRELAAADRPAIERMLAECGAFSGEECKVALELVDDCLTSGEAFYQHVVAQLGETVVGYVCLGRTPMTQSTWHLYWICVSPAFQRQGVARRGGVRGVVVRLRFQYIGKGRNSHQVGHRRGAVLRIVDGEVLRLRRGQLHFDLLRLARRAQQLYRQLLAYLPASGIKRQRLGKGA